MKLLVGHDALGARAVVARDELAPLATGLAAELKAVEAHELYLPTEKALLSRAGGRCERDGATLEFDPFSPNRHRCPVCGVIHVGELHDRNWVFWYQLWLAERALHGALLGRLLCDDAAIGLATSILERYSDQYLLYPNRDNVLGPTRVFFSTYLESIWLLNLCIALDLLEIGGSSALGARVRERIIDPSAALIGSYDEGASNRQVWNDAAILAAARLLGREEDAERAVFGRSGVLYHLEHGLLADGTWYEGENYHLFAHRGLWYGVTMAEHAKLGLPAAAVARFQEGFATPFLTALPDMTLPSRRDSQYAISLRQPRFAELCELGLAREKGEGDRRLRTMLHHLYDDSYPRGEIGRWNATADVERNLPGTKLSRADLGWRSLLFARPHVPPAGDAPLGTVLLEAQGIAVFRREQGRVYVALDYGTSGGGHGHPDRLNVLLADGDTRWLDDMGTGSYVDPSLHWYRSTLAHNAPRFNGRDQEQVDGELIAFEENAEIGWVSARADELSPRVSTRRSLVVLQDYFVDELRWEAPEVVRMDLPIHVEPSSLTIDGSTPPPAGAAQGALPDSRGLVRDVSSQSLGAHSTVHITARAGSRVLHGFALTSSPAVLYQATAPGPPGGGARRLLVLSVATSGGPQWVRTVWSWTNRIATVSTAPEGLSLTVLHADGAEDHHVATVGGWQITRIRDSAREYIVLDQVRQRTANVDTAGRRSVPAPYRLTRERLLEFELGEQNYRRSEESWKEAGRPTARVGLRLAPNELVVEISVHKEGELTFVPVGATNPYDNEHPDTNGDGIQLFLSDASGASGWVLVPERSAGAKQEPGAEAPVHVRTVEGWSTPRALHAVWHRTDDGYDVRVRVPEPATDSAGRFSLGVVVNEKSPQRARRRGQLVLGGGAGEFVYLRGDREDRDRLPVFEIAT